MFSERGKSILKLWEHFFSINLIPFTGKITASSLRSSYPLFFNCSVSLNESVKQMWSHLGKVGSA